MKQVSKWVMLMLAAMMLFGCGRKLRSPSSGLVIYSPHPLEFIDMIAGEFEKDYGIKVTVVFAGTGELLDMIKKTPANQPLSPDVLWGGAMSTLRANIDLFEPYVSINDANFFEEYKDKEGVFTPFSAIPSVIMVNRNLMGQKKINGYQDLLDPGLRGKIAYANPEASSSSYEHLINMLYAMGKGNPIAGWTYMKQFVEQLDGTLLPGSVDVYTGVAEGKFSVGLTFEEVAASYVNQGAPIEVIYPVEGTIIKPDGVSIVKGTKNLENAKKFVDFVTSYEIQKLISAELHRRSVRDDVALPNGLKDIDDIYQIHDDTNWSSSFKYEILEQFHILFDGN